MSFQDKMTETANWVARKIPGAKSALRPIYYPIKTLFRKSRNKAFRKKGLSVLMDFHKCMEQNGYHYTLAFGTLLGAVREKGFIRHDLDIDVYLWNEEWNDRLRQCLRSYGFDLESAFLVDDGLSGREETYIKDGVSIDIFYIYPAVNQLPYCCDFISPYYDAPTRETCMKKYGGLQPRRLEMPFEQKRELCKFETVELYIPQNAKELLEFRYGKDFMIPNPNWTITSFDNHIVVWQDKKGIYYKFK